MAGLLAIAEAVQQRPLGPRRTLVFVAFGAEETGLVGSQRFAGRGLANVVQLMTLDTIKYYYAGGGVHAFGAFPPLPARQLLDRIAADRRGVRVRAGGHSVRGDQVWLREAGVPYVSEQYAVGGERLLAACAFGPVGRCSTPLIM